ncbi:MAG: GNAT family N-acetyltransferase [Isosphaeraceae bacterium]
MPMMYPLRNPDLRHWPAEDDSLRRRVAIGHALRMPGYERAVWGDQVRRPHSLFLARKADDRWEAFGAGKPNPSISWLLGGQLKAELVLVGPPAWHEAVAKRGGTAQFGQLETWIQTDPGRPPAAGPPGTEALVRPIAWDEKAAFLALAPPWALRAWRAFELALAESPMFAIPHRDGSGFASMAWVCETDNQHASIGVATDERYRGLGLGRAVARALIGALQAGPAHQRRLPAWFTEAENAPSRALAESLGFRHQRSEPLARWRALTA